MNLLRMMSLTMIIILILQTFIGATKSILALKTGQCIDASLILGYYKHILKLPQQFFDTMRVGEIISRVNDAVKIRTFINDVFLNVVVNVMILIVTLTCHTDILMEAGTRDFVRDPVLFTDICWI